MARALFGLRIIAGRRVLPAPVPSLARSRLAIVAEFNNGPKYAKYADRIAKFTSMAVLDVEQHRSLFADAGFTRISVDEHAAAGWLTVVGSK